MSGTREALIAQGWPPECVDFACPLHRRGCCRLGTDHELHECYWCVTAGLHCGIDLGPE